MANIDEIRRKAQMLALRKTILHEGFGYPEGMTERIERSIEERIMNRETAIGDHPALPKGGVRGFDQKLLLDRFLEVVNRYKDAFDVSEIDLNEAINIAPMLLNDCITTEKPHRKKLEELAVDMIREEYDLSEESLIIEAKLVDKVLMKNKLSNKTSDEEFQMEFEKHADIENAEAEVMNRRFINCMIQGAAMRCNHMFNLKNDELQELDPRLPSKYKKLTSSADYMYFVVPDDALDENSESQTKSTIGGMVDVDFDEDGTPIILAEAMTLPVLIHELVKGVMEVIAQHGFTNDDKLNEYVVSQADFLAAEPSDMRMGPALWGKLMEAIDPKDSHLKHQVFYNLIKKPTNEFNESMKEILAGTKEGKRQVAEIIEGVKSRVEIDDLTEDENVEREEDYGSHIRRSASELRDLLGRDFEDLFGDDLGS
jgi:hypothetical protein